MYTIGHIKKALKDLHYEEYCKRQLNNRNFVNKKCKKRGKPL